MTILIGFHQSYYRNFKSYYLEKVQTQWQSHFPKLVSYNRFIEWIPDTLIPLCGYLRSCFGTCTGISFMDSTYQTQTQYETAFDVSERSPVVTQTRCR